MDFATMEAQRRAKIMRKTTTAITVLALVTGIAFSACGRGFIAPANGTVPGVWRSANSINSGKSKNQRGRP
jgi:hypothetical protein